MEFIEKYAKVDDSDKDTDDDNILKGKVSYLDFIVDVTKHEEQQPLDYYPLFKNVTRGPEEAAKDQSLTTIIDAFINSEPKNYYQGGPDRE